MKKIILYLFLISIIFLISVFKFEKAKEIRKEKNYNNSILYKDKTKKLNDWKKINNDVLFVLEINKKSFPVVKGRGNFYLEYNIYKEKDKYGTIFLENDFDDNNLFIYGHSSSEQDVFFTFMKRYLENKKEDLKDILNFEIILDDEKIKYYISAIKTFDLEDFKEDLSFMDIIDDKGKTTKYIKNFHKKANKIFRIIDSKKNKYPLITFITCDLTKKDARYIVLCQPV